MSEPIPSPYYLIMMFINRYLSISDLYLSQNDKWCKDLGEAIKKVTADFIFISSPNIKSACLSIDEYIRILIDNLDFHYNTMSKFHSDSYLFAIDMVRGELIEYMESKNPPSIKPTANRSAFDNFKIYGKIQEIHFVLREISSTTRSIYLDSINKDILIKWVEDSTFGSNLEVVMRKSDDRSLADKLERYANNIIPGKKVAIIY